MTSEDRIRELAEDTLSSLDMENARGLSDLLKLRAALRAYRNEVVGECAETYPLGSTSYDCRVEICALKVPQ